MSLAELLRDFTERTQTIEEVRRQLRTLQRQARDDETALDRETRHITIASFKTVGIELTPHNLAVVLGAMRKVADWINDARQRELLRKSGEALIEQFTEVLASVKAGADHVDPMITSDGLLVDPQSTAPVDLLVILQRNPIDVTGTDGKTSDQIDAVAHRYGLKRYTHVNSRNPVCVLVGEVSPNSIADFVDQHDGVMVHNRSGGTFRGPDRTTDPTDPSQPQPDAQPEEVPSSASDESRYDADPEPAPADNAPTLEPEAKGEVTDTRGADAPAGIDRDANAEVMPSNGPAPAPQKPRPLRPNVTRDANGNVLPKPVLPAKKEKTTPPIGDENFTAGADDENDQGSAT